MPRRWRVDRQICHVCNRAAAKLAIFKTGSDYRAFLRLLHETKIAAHGAIKLYGYCIMPNHWHLIICPDSTAGLSQFMHRLTSLHARNYLADHPERSGAIYQGRFRCVPVQDGRHLKTVLLYVDRNPLRARLVGRAEDWLWSSILGHAGEENDPLLDPLPGELFTDWRARVNEVGPMDDLTRTALRTNAPVGDAEWIARLSGEWNVMKKKRGRPGNSNRVQFT